MAARAGQSFFAATATPGRGGITRAGQSGRGSWPRRRPPRRRGGTPDEPARRGVSGELRPRQRAQTHLATARAGRARWRPPRMTRRVAGERARPALGDTRGRRTGRETDPRPCPPPRHRPPGGPPRPPTRYGNARPVVSRPSTTNRAKATLPAALRWHHAPPHPRRQAAGELGACDTTAARRRQRRTGPPRRGGLGATGSSTTGQLPGPTHQLPPHRPPTHRPTPHPGRPSARPSQDRGGRAWRHGRRCIPRPALAGHGLHCSPQPPTHPPFSVSPC